MLIILLILGTLNSGGNMKLVKLLLLGACLSFGVSTLSYATVSSSQTQYKAGQCGTDGIYVPGYGCVYPGDSGSRH